MTLPADTSPPTPPPPHSAGGVGDIPVVDFAPFLLSSPLSESQAASRLATANALVAAFQNIGFVYISNHGLSDSLLNEVFAKAKAFFALPDEAKLKIAWKSAEDNRGYSRGERLSQSTDKDEVQRLREKAPDLKEFVNIGKEDDRSHPNLWPEDVKGFKETMLQMFDTAHQLHFQVMRAIAVGLSLPETFFDRYIDARDHNLRLLRYPPAPVSAIDRDERTRAGAHSDYGTITLLFQDDRGGLQVLGKDNQWIDATPIPGTIVVNAGDLLQRWSNDVIRSTLHRVVAPPPIPGENDDGAAAMHPERFSIPFFCSPNMDAMIEGLPGVGDGKKYEPIRALDHLLMRLKATY
ncbi:hypothetical protein DFJ73DRAFT_812982 [Zopfochytrium polystomum]|nr:hypothetical protein DFJ73DRAFT_812982 [Zopfochytrium polystomum]